MRALPLPLLVESGSFESPAQTQKPHLVRGMPVQFEASIQERDTEKANKWVQV